MQNTQWRNGNGMCAQWKATVKEAIRWSKILFGGYTLIGQQKRMIGEKSDRIAFWRYLRPTLKISGYSEEYYDWPTSQHIPFMRSWHILCAIRLSILLIFDLYTPCPRYPLLPQPEPILEDCPSIGLLVDTSMLLYDIDDLAELTHDHRWLSDIALNQLICPSNSTSINPAGLHTYRSSSYNVKWIPTHQPHVPHGIFTLADCLGKMIIAIWMRLEAFDLLDRYDMLENWSMGT